MNVLDIIILLPLVYGAFRGFINGFVHEILYFAFLVLSVFFGYRFVVFISELIETKYDYHSDFLKLYAFIGILIVMMIVIYFITKSIESLLGLVGLGIINKLAGALFGIAKWALLVSLILYMIAAFDGDQDLIKKDVKAKSLLFQPATQVALLLIPSMEIATVDIKGKVNEVTKKIKKN